VVEEEVLEEEEEEVLVVEVLTHSLLQPHGEVDHGHVGRGHAERHASQLPVHPERGGSGTRQGTGSTHRFAP